MTRPDEIAALADELDACARNPGRDSTECAVEGELLRRVAAALRLSATSPGDAVRMREAFRQIIVEMRDKHSSPTGDSYSCGVWDQSQRILSKLDEAALAPAEKAGDDEGFGSVRGKLDHLGRRVDAVDMPQALKDSIARCYGLLWMLETEDKRAHRARRGLLSWLTKDEQVWGIENAKAICLMNGLDDGSSQKDCPGTATPTPPSADVVDHTPTSNSDVAEALTQAFEYFDSHADVIDGDYGVPEPNREMRLAQMCEDALELIQSAAPGGGTEGGSYIDDVERSFDETPLADSLKPSDSAQEPDAVATLTYTNWRGETSVRRIIPKSVRRGSTEWHPEPQWLLLAYDTDKGADREFALKDFGTRPVSLDREAVMNAIEKYVAIQLSHEYPSGMKVIGIGGAADAIIALIKGRT